LCEYVTAKGGARAKAKELAQEIARLSTPEQNCIGGPEE
jgi:hypothetical protein